MSVIRFNGTVGAGETAVGRALAAALPGAAFLDGDDFAGPRDAPGPPRWRRALNALLRRVARPRRAPILVVAYPLDRAALARLRAACGRARRRPRVVNLATPVPIVLLGRGGRRPDGMEREAGAGAGDALGGPSPAAVRRTHPGGCPRPGGSHRPPGAPVTGSGGGRSHPAASVVLGARERIPGRPGA